ncbi:acyl carrier protein [Alteromonas sp. a30]|uniref:acyl carrier protein n=1 Tax=Alteromonas sp. a30 TaxID=2730917 RepID=UPI0022829B66|nr:acyl carrier protein [Alteromonas sp. a30]MCY7296471.1 acyl carrier protein [Alteromonas sp. a30]
MSKLPDLKQYITEEFIPDGNNDHLADDLDLIASGVIDSLGVLKLVAFIENTYDITLEPEEIDPENLKSIDAVSKLVESRGISLA